MTEPIVKKPKSRRFLIALGAIATTIATIAHLLVGAPLPSTSPIETPAAVEAPAEPAAVEAPAVEEVAQ